ncbi:MAG: prepilin peptidase [Xanthobacteraceae bacterium]
MQIAEMLHRFQAFLFFHDEFYELTIKSATVILLCYIALIDLRTFKIENKSVVLLFVFYILYALAARTGREITSDVFVGVSVLGFLLWSYTRGAVGGGDVKLLPVVCLWVGAHCAMLFSALLLVFIVLHLIIVRSGWASARAINGRRATLCTIHCGSDARYYFVRMRIVCCANRRTRRSSHRPAIVSAGRGGRSGPLPWRDDDAAEYA